jgi:predicted ATPase
MALLGHLLRHSGELVTKQQLLDAVWPNTSVSDAVLKVCISEIRRALGDGVNGARLIETRHGRGYRLTAPIFDCGSTAIDREPTKPLIARDSGMAALTRYLERAIAGERQTVFVTGEPGLGKTALVEAFVGRALARHVVWVACGHAVRYQGPGEPFEPVLEALNQLNRQVGQDALVALLGSHAPTWLSHLSWASAAQSQPAESTVPSDASRARMLREMTQALTVLTSERPLVLVLEDLQCADCSTLDLVAFLARPLEPARLLIVATAQPFVSLPGVDPLTAIKQELAVHRRCNELPLTAFQVADVASYLEAQLANGRWPPGLADRIHRCTEGNPLYVVNLIDDLLRRNVIVAAGDGWQMEGPLKQVDAHVPDLVRELTAMNFERLESLDRRILEAGSVAGREFSAAVVAAALGEDPLAIEERCEQLVRRQQYIQPAGAGRRPDGRVAARFRFIHAFARQVLSQQMGPCMRMRFRTSIRRSNEARLEPHIGLAARPVTAAMAQDHRLERRRR